MARRTPSRDSKLKQGRGKGHGKDYKPYLTVRDVPSQGLSHRIKGWKTERVHHLLSNLEKNYFFVLEWSPNVVDIKEQYPLPLEATIAIADRLGIKHPTNPKTKEPEDMTTDFLIDFLIGDRTVPKARTVKLSEDLNNSRVLEKLEIERTFWNENGTDWGIVTDLDIPMALAKNVEWLHSALDPNSSPNLSLKIIYQIEESLFGHIVSDTKVRLSHVCLCVDDALGLKAGSSLWVVKHLIASRQWCVDMSKTLAPDKPLTVARAENILRQLGG